jgi:AcrR family transcriptional regulator
MHEVVRSSGSEVESKKRILDAAEELFVMHGFDGASMRDITSRAGVALALANYHFGTCSSRWWPTACDRSTTNAFAA